MDFVRFVVPPRMAYAKMNKHKEAEDAYKNALRLDPDNSDYQNNLSVTQQRMQEGKRTHITAATYPLAGLFVGFSPLIEPDRLPVFCEMCVASVATPNNPAEGLPAEFGDQLGGLNFNAAFNNPALMNLATQMMTDPAMQDTITQLRSQISGMNNMNGIFEMYAQDEGRLHLVGVIDMGMATEVASGIA